MVPELDGAAERLLAFVEGLPVRVGERDRLIRALDVLASEEWTRVMVRCSAEDLGGLRLAAGDFTPDELSQVVSFGQTVAGVYGFEHTGVAHIAIGLVLTTRVREGANQLQMVHVVAEAFGLGTLEDVDKLRNQHYSRRETPEVEEESLPGITLGRRGRRQYKLATRAHLAFRCLAAVVLLYLAVIGDSWTAWPIAALALIVSRDSRETPLHFGEEVRPGLRTVVPLPAGWAVLAGVLGLYDAAAVFLVLGILLEFTALGAEALVAKEHRLYGERPDSISDYIARIASVPERFVTRRRLSRLTTTVLIAVLPTAAAFSPASELWPLYAVAALMVVRKTSALAVLVLLIAGFVDGWPILLVVAPFVFAAGWIARGMIRWNERPPRAITPIPWINPPGSKNRRIHRKARRLLHLDRPLAAARVLEAADEPVLKALHGWALLQAGRPGDAKDAMAGLSEPFAAVKDLVTLFAELELSNARAAERVADRLKGPHDGSAESRRFNELNLLAFTRATMLANPFMDDVYGAALAKHSSLSVDHGSLLHTAMTLRVIAEGLLRTNPALAETVAAMGFMLLHWERDSREARFFGLIGENRQVAVETTRSAAVLERAGLRLSKKTRFPNLEEGAATFLLHLDRPMEAAALLNETADALALTTYKLAALDKRLEALAVLQWTRHQLRNLSERRTWWRTASETLEKAMAQAAAGQDWETLAELIEAARLQLGPQDGEAAVGLAGATAPFVRVRGTSRLEQAAWYRPGERPASYNLEDLATYVLGEGTWWWSTWSAGDSIFWALVPPDGRVSGGVMPCGRDSDVADTLADLRTALPILYPGEDELSFYTRVFGGPLCGPLKAEGELARRLGDLLPEQLKKQRDIRLAIAPALEFANIPWTLVAVAGDTRLVEVAELAIAPPAALLAATARRTTASEHLPLSLAVLNPAGDLIESANSLQDAATLVDLLPAETVKVTATDSLQVDEFGAILRKLPHESTAIFACHTASVGSTPLSGGLQLRPAVEDRFKTPEILTAGLLIEQPETYPVPRQAMLLACESADLRQAAEGEWLVLGPAMLWAGAERLIVTNYPVLDGSTIDGRLIQHLLDDDGGDLSAALRQAQIEQLTVWRSGAPAHAWPLYWASHVAMGAYGNKTLRPQPAKDRFVHESLTKVIDSAAKWAALAGRTEVLSRDLLQELAIYGYEDDLPLPRKLAIRAIAYPAALANEARGRIGGNQAVGDIALSDEVRKLLREAAKHADNARHRVVDVEHLLTALLASDGVRIATARLISGWDTRQPEVVKELLAETQEMYQHLGMPVVRHLSADAVRSIYAAAGAELPDEPSKPVLLNDQELISSRRGSNEF